MVPVVPDIHGRSTAQVQALQQAAAQALGRPVVFRDPSFTVHWVEKVETGRRKRWFGPDEPIIEEREVTKTIAPPEMVIIPAGRFLMGSPDSEAKRFHDEGPQHPVTVSRYSPWGAMR
jgi:formylglycine-generating enzyme required for sulfatase activity